MRSDRVPVTRLWAALAAVTLGALLSGCAQNRVPAELAVPPTAQTVEEKILYAPATWSGDVRVVRPLLVTRGASLTLLPGTRVYFDLPAPAPGETPTPWILVMGSLVATGTPEQPVVFTSVRRRVGELEDMVQIQKGKEAHFRHCRFERGPWGLHVHETPVEVTNSVFRDSYGGVRFLGGPVRLRGNRFEGNRIGVRCLKGSPVIEENEFLANLTGIFFREGVQDPVVRRNNFDNLEYDVKLGEGQAGDVVAAGNWWRAAAAGTLAERLYDGADSEGLGRIVTEPALAAPWGRQE